MSSLLPLLCAYPCGRGAGDEPRSSSHSTGRYTSTGRLRSTNASSHRSPRTGCGDSEAPALAGCSISCGSSAPQPVGPRDAVDTSCDQPARRVHSADASPALVGSPGARQTETGPRPYPRHSGLTAASTDLVLFLGQGFDALQAPGTSYPTRRHCGCDGNLHSFHVSRLPLRLPQQAPQTA